MEERSVYRMVGRKEDTTGISTRVKQISVSAIKQMPVLASKVEGCISLGQGIPSFTTPSFIIEGVIEALRREAWIGTYSLQPGLPALRQAVARRLGETKGIDVDPETELFISCGAMEALAAGVATVIERGDEVLLPSPNYSSHIEQVLFAEGIPVFVPLIEEAQRSGEAGPGDPRALAAAFFSAIQGLATLGFQRKHLEKGITPRMLSNILR